MNHCEISPETYAYDLLGNLVRTESGSITNFHVYDGAQSIADLDSTGGVVRSYVWGTGIDNLLAMSVHTGSVTKTYYAITDHLGSVHALVDDTGAVVESYKFDAWGRVLEVRDSSGQLSMVNGLWSSPLGNRYLWQGREYSFATGLYNFRARWYDPITGRWLSNDPIGISGGLNQYVFCGDNPVMFVDPSGLEERKGANAGQIQNNSTNVVNVYASEYGVTNVPPSASTPPGDWDSVECPAGSGNWKKIGPGKSKINKKGEIESGWRRALHKLKERAGYKPENVPKPPKPQDEKPKE